MISEISTLFGGVHQVSHWQSLEEEWCCVNNKISHESAIHGSRWGKNTKPFTSNALWVNAFFFLYYISELIFQPLSEEYPFKKKHCFIISESTQLFQLFVIHGLCYFILNCTQWKLCFCSLWHYRYYCSLLLGTLINVQDMQILFYLPRPSWLKVPPKPNKKKKGLIRSCVPSFFLLLSFHLSIIFSFLSFLFLKFHLFFWKFF